MKCAIARQISHPNVCRVYDIGEADGHHFLSMEYVDGEDLASVLRRIGRLPGDKAIEIARQLCAGLAAAHDKGVLHRDLKPANVMIDGQGRVRITDFGLAAIVGAGDRRATSTRARPRYMAPEQIAGREVSVASDIFSLGLVLFELFTGKRGLQGATRRRSSRLHQENRRPRRRASCRISTRRWSGSSCAASRAIPRSAPLGATRCRRAPGRRSARGGARRGGDAVARNGRERACGGERQAGRRDRVCPLRGGDLRLACFGEQGRLKGFTRSDTEPRCERRTFSRRRDSRVRPATRTVASVQAREGEGAPVLAALEPAAIGQSEPARSGPISVRAPAGRARERHGDDGPGRTADPVRSGAARGEPGRGGFSRQGRSSGPRGLAGPCDRGRLRRDSDDPRRSFRPSGLPHRLRHGLERAGHPTQ